jgi:hypothetical protein
LQVLAEGASTEGVHFSNGCPLLRPVNAHLAADAYALSVARFAANLTGRARQLALQRAALALPSQSAAALPSQPVAAGPAAAAAAPAPSAAGAVHALPHAAAAVAPVGTARQQPVVVSAMTGVMAAAQLGTPVPGAGPGLPGPAHVVAASGQLVQAAQGAAASGPGGLMATAGAVPATLPVATANAGVPLGALGRGQQVSSAGSQGHQGTFGVLAPLP